MRTMVATGLVASPDSCFREKAGKMLEQAGIQVVAHIGACLEPPTLVGTLQTDILVLDTSSLGSEAMTQLSGIHRSNPKMLILMATDAMADEFVETALQHGARGFVSKSGDCEELVRAVHAVTGGEIWLCRMALSHALESLLQKMGHPGNPHWPAGSPENLSPRERGIVRLIALGMTNKEIARELGMSAMTVKSHLSIIFAKLGVTRRAQLAQSFTPSLH